MNLGYDVFVNDPPPQDNGLLPNGEPKGGSPVASTLIYGSRDAVLTDPGPRHIVAGHQNRRLADDAERTIDETRQYLDDADELLRSETTAVGFFNAKIERYPDYLARTVLWAGVSALYGVREHPGQDAEHVAQILVAGWL